MIWSCPRRSLIGVLLLFACAAVVGVVTGASAATSATSATSARGGITKVLVVVEENHSLAQMQQQMPYLNGLADRYGYADDYTGITYPSLPNYLAIAGGSTFGVHDDAAPAAHPVRGQSVFGQALAHGHTAHVYAEAEPTDCDTAPAGRYQVKHNPWPYFTAERAACARFDTPAAGFAEAARSDALPAVGMLAPDMCHDAHDCPLSTADSWLKTQLPAVLASPDFTSGRLVVVVTADTDDRSAGNRVLTVVLHRSLAGRHLVVHRPLDHYSLTRLYAQVAGVPPLRSGAGAPDLAAAFGLPLR